MGARLIVGLAVSLLAASAGCGSHEEPSDPLDPELVRELAHARGTASGSARSGLVILVTSIDSCDCPSVELDDQSVDTCLLAALPVTQLQLLESEGVLAFADGAESKALMLTGAIEADGSFTVTEARNLATLAGPLEILRRMDGQFLDENRAEGWAGQRLLGELAGDNVDCRWIGSFVAVRQ